MGVKQRLTIGPGCGLLGREVADVPAPGLATQGVLLELDVGSPLARPAVPVHAHETVFGNDIFVKKMGACAGGCAWRQG